MKGITMFYGGGLIGLIILILDIYAIILIIQSSMPPLNKLIWILVILCLPLLGVLLFFLLGNKRLN